MLSAEAVFPWLFDWHPQGGYWIGFPGHGAIWEQIWITNNSDLGAKKRIMILFFTQKKKWSRSPVGTCESSTNKRSRNKSEERSLKLAQADETVSELEQKNSSKYWIEQLNVWEHMLQLKKHDSQEVPHDKPFFQIRGSKSRTISPKKGKLSSVSCGVSLGKQIGLHTEFLLQLDKWHQLFERGATSVFFKEMQETILEEMKTLWVN